MRKRPWGRRVMAMWPLSGLTEEGPGSAGHPGPGASVREPCVRVEEGIRVHEQLLAAWLSKQKAPGKAR